MHRYSRLDRLLHQVALGSESVRRAAFDVERRLARGDVEQVGREPHVFIAGLARAGTSILLRLLHGSGCFATQTYRDMPFVLAPQLWQRISGRSRVQGEEAERAHKDGLGVSFDSVEAFEEVFWLTFARDLYVRNDFLTAHAVDEDLAADFRDYVAVVIAAQDKRAVTRYLSKNNNNILRLPGLRRALPASRIVVPFREPYQQARSLLRQHLQFKASQASDRFGRKYMGWLGHFEFGLDYRPFCPDDRSPRMWGSDPNSVEHWLQNWTQVYRHALATAPADAVFWDYDAFCTDPRESLALLAQRLDLDGKLVPEAATEIRAPRDYDGDRPDGAVLRAARATYDELRHRARTA